MTAPPPRPAPRRAAALWLAAALLALPTASCSRCSGEPQRPVAPAPREPGPDETLLVVDGITVRFGDLADAIAWFDTLQTEVSRRVKMQRILEEFTLPLLFARREFAQERADKLAQAKALAAVTGNAIEVEQRADALHGERRTVTPRDVEIPIAQFLFDPLHTGARSEPIELPQGFIVVGSFHVALGGITTADRCDAIQVPFYTHDRVAYREWLRHLQETLPKKLTYFHPDYRDAMPPWLLP